MANRWTPMQLRHRFKSRSPRRQVSRVSKYAVELPTQGEAAVLCLRKVEAKIGDELDEEGSDMRHV